MECRAALAILGLGLLGGACGPAPPAQAPRPADDTSGDPGASSTAAGQRPPSPKGDGDGSRDLAAAASQAAGATKRAGVRRPPATGASSASSSPSAAIRPTVDRHGDPLPRGAIARAGSTRYRYPGDWVGGTMTATGFVVASVAGGKLRFTDLAPGKQLRSIGSRWYGASGVQVSEDGSVVLRERTKLQIRSGTDGTLLREITVPADPKTGKGKRPLPLGTARSEALSPDGRLIAVSTPAKRLHLFDARQGTLRRTTITTAALTQLSLSRDGRRLLAAEGASHFSSPKAYRIFDTATARQVGRIELGDDHRNAELQLSPDGTLVAVRIGRDIVLRNPATGAPEHELSFPKPPKSSRFGGLSLGSSLSFGRSVGSGMIFSRDGSKLAASDGKSLRVWAIESGDELAAVESKSLRPVAFSPDGKKLGAIRKGGRGLILDLHSGDPLPRPPGHDGPVGHAALSPDGRLLATTGGDRVLMLWDADSGELLRETQRKGGYGRVEMAGPFLYVQSSGGLLYRASTDRPRAKLLRPKGSYGGAAMAVSANGDYAAMPERRSWDDKGEPPAIEIWDRSGSIAHTIEIVAATPKPDDSTPEIGALALSRAGHRVAALVKSKIHVFETSGQKIGVFEPPRWTLNDRLDFVDGGTKLVAGGSSDVALLDVGAGRWLRLITSPGSGGATACSPDGTLVALASREREVRLYGLTDGLPRGTLRGHSGEITALSFSADSRRLATASKDGTALIWQVADAPPSKRSRQPSWLDTTQLPAAAAEHFATRFGSACSIDAQGGLTCTGDRRFEAAQGNRLTDVVDVHADYYFMCGLQRSGAVQCWGESSEGQLGRIAKAASPPTPIAGLRHVTAFGLHRRGGCALDRSGVVQCWGRPFDWSHKTKLTQPMVAPRTIAGLGSTRALAVGDDHACALRSDGAVHCWGKNPDGRLGNGSTVASSSPVRVRGVHDAIGIAAGAAHSCALRRGGRVLCWGAGQSHQLGDGGGLSRDEPTGVTGIDDAVQIVAAGPYSCVRRRSGQVRCWGDLGAWLYEDHDALRRPEPVGELAPAKNLHASPGALCAEQQQGPLRCVGIKLRKKP